MAKVDIYLKGGAMIPLDVEDFTMTLSATGEPYRVKWKNGKSKPIYIGPVEIAAVIER
jgi:hypothetical protein